jgi:hypothetical protein
LVSRAAFRPTSCRHMYCRINDRLGDDPVHHRLELVAGSCFASSPCDSRRDCWRTTIVAHPEAKRSLHVSTGALAVDNRIPRSGERRCRAGSSYGRGPRYHGSGHPRAPCCRFGYGACKRDDRSRHTNPRDNETAWRTTDAASHRSGRSDRIRCTASLPQIAWPRLRATFLASMWASAELERRDSGLRFGQALPQAFMMHYLNPFGSALEGRPWWACCDRTRQQASPHRLERTGR